MSTHSIETCGCASVADEQKASYVHRLVPDVDIYEKDGTVVLLVDMPGVDGKSVELSTEAKKLSLIGTVKNSDENTTAEYHRTFTLADDVNRDAITAAMTNGVLRVELPKKEKAPLKKITVTS